MKQLTTLRAFATALKTVKVMAANSVDGNIVGVDSVSGESYFQDFPSVGTVYKTDSGVHKVIVDAIAYPAHVTNGTRYKDEIRFVAVSFDPDTLVLGPDRTNIGFDAMMKHKRAGRVISIDIWTYVEQRELKIAEAQRRAALAAQREAERKAAARAAQLAAQKAAEEKARREEQQRIMKANIVRVAINNF